MCYILYDEVWHQDTDFYQLCTDLITSSPKESDWKSYVEQPMAGWKNIWNMFIAVFAVVLHFEGKVATIRPLFKKSQYPISANRLFYKLGAVGNWYTKFTIGIKGKGYPKSRK